ncbi:MAG: COG4223 family protein, partial [Alphaproteobacteria bacterium]
DPAIGATFEGVPPSDLKAAAFLLGMTQFRSSLGRDNKPFADDLGLLVKLSGENDPALKESILKLAPYAEQGILTPHGLGNEFKAITGDVVVASLKGEDVSVKDKAKARLNEVFKVEKNGELVTGTPTQATLAKTEDFLNTGNIEAAIIEMKKLQGPAGGAAAPWINQAEATLMAQKLKLSLSHAINAKAAGSITAGGGPLIPGTLIQNEDTGINIYKKN